MVDTINFSSWLRTKDTTSASTTGDDSTFIDLTSSPRRASIDPRRGSSSSHTSLRRSSIIKVRRGSSTTSQFHCSKGHELILKPVTSQREAICGSCNCRILIKPVHILSYHCTVCVADACSDCISKEMRIILLHERSQATVSKVIVDQHGEGIYYGRLCIEGKRDGYGKMEWFGENNGCAYVGHWKDDKRDGHGKCFYADGGSYEGVWSSDEKCGYGRRIYSNGFRYYGPWEEGKKNGTGLYKGDVNRWFLAEWCNDEMVGTGKFPVRIKPSASRHKDRLS